MKSDRHKKILEIIKNNNIYTQDEIVEALQNQGYDVTQATVSRDIKYLNINKSVLNGKQQYVVSQPDAEASEKFIRILQEGFVDMDTAQNILVIKTVPGMAMAVCAAIDSMNWNELVGSIAGDDTIMCAVKSVNDTKLLKTKISNMLSRKIM